jgi:hypothetical protein
MIKNVRKELKELAKNKVIGLDIETITILRKGKKSYVAPFEVGFYSPKEKKGITLYINPFFHKHLNNDKRIMQFYKPQKYVNGSGYLLTLKQVREVLKDITFNTLYGHNVIKFDLLHLSNFNINFKGKHIFDTYLNAGNGLPLKYYQTLTEWNETGLYDNKFITEKGNLKMSAEAIYCFLSNNPDFKEKHTAVADCQIEFEIYKYLKKRISFNDANSDGNWLTVLKNYFSKFKNKVAKEKIEYLNKFNWYNTDNEPYTQKLLKQYLSSA